MKALPCISALFTLALAAFAGQPQLRTLKVTLDQYPLTNYLGGSNAVLTVYKSTSLGTVWTPFKPTSIFPATRTNQLIQVLAGNTYRFHLTVTIQPYGESDPSETVTNRVSQ